VGQVVNLRRVVNPPSGHLHKASPGNSDRAFHAGRPIDIRPQVNSLPHSQRGSALLSVLWLSAALAAIAFSLAITVRGELERTSTSIDGLRAYYLARGGVDRASLELLWSISQAPDKRLIPPYSTEVLYHFATGDVRVELIPEASKLDVNRETPEALDRLMVAMGVDPGRAAEIAAAIDDWRRVPAQGGLFDGYYSMQSPSFLPPHASFQEIEELLQVKGVTPDIFYGTYAPAGQQTLNGPSPLVRHSGLVDCLSVFGARGAVDANTASPAVLAAVGIPAGVVAIIVQRRTAAPFTQQQLVDFLGAMGIPAAPLRVEGNSILTIRATARLRVSGGQLSDLRRTVAAQVKYMPLGSDTPIHILRWYDTAWSN
jgi:general secretion pathway protein K